MNNNLNRERVQKAAEIIQSHPQIVVIANQKKITLQQIITIFKAAGLEEKDTKDLIDAHDPTKPENLDKRNAATFIKSILDAYGRMQQ